MSEAVPLLSFTVTGYRAIRHLQIPELGMVNLFVGNNNVGKTSLLEAFRLYASDTPTAVLFELVQERGDYRPPAFSRARGSEPRVAEEAEALTRAVEGLFYGSYSGLSVDPIRIGAGNDEDHLLTLMLPSNSPGIVQDVFVGPETPLIEIERAGRRSSVPLELFMRRVPIARLETRAVTFVPAGGFESFRLNRLWDRVASLGAAPEVEDALRTIIPDLERVYLLGEATSRRSVAVQLKGTARPVPLRSLGDGANRVFGMALALVQARGGLVLIDEVENGLHYSIQEEVWRAILLLSQKLRVQVLATTHSWDCIRAFSSAANDDSGVQGMLHRLERRSDGALRVVEISEEDLAIVVRQKIEVR
jgi:hypothetical protein